MQELKQRYDGKIVVEIGLKIEYLPSFQWYFEELAGNEKLDLLMIGQYFYEVRPGKYSYSLFEEREEYKGCLEAIMQGLETRIFQFVAHPDRSFRNIYAWDKECEMKSRQLIGLAEKRNVVLEKNISSMKREKYYWEEFWSLLSPENKTILGLDAHGLKELEYCFL